MKQIFAYLLLLIFSCGLLHSDEVIRLNGYLAKDNLVSAQETINKAIKNENPKIIIEIDSTGGDINQVLDFTKTVYLAKLKHRLQVIVYIADKAIGPAAIIPFLADERYISPLISWGDIPLGNENVLPTNLLRNQVLSLILPEQSHQNILALLASAMSDKSIQIVDDNGWKIEGSTTSPNPHAVTRPGETLVVNQHQVEKLGLASGILTQESFQNKWSSESPQPILNSEKKNISDSIYKKLKDHIHYKQDATNQIGYITIEDHSSSINQGTWLYVKNALDYYKQTHPAFIILELNTPGGEVFAAQKISDALKEIDTQYNIPVVCFINNWAISAGAMLAYSCRFISIVKDASMGAAEPLTIGINNEMEVASEKVNSALRADFANRASFFDRNPHIAEAMVDKDIILVFRHGEVTKLDNESQIKSSGYDSDIIISSKGKLLTLNSEELMRYGVADMLLLPEKIEQILTHELETGSWPAKKMLLFQAPFFKDIPEATINAYQMDWKSRFFALLANPLIASLLLLGVMVGFYTEISSPGFGVPGAIGVICLVLIVLSSYALEIASSLELILLFVGLAIMLIDLFLLPTFGLLGFAGLVFFLMGLFGLLLPGIGEVEYELDTKTFNAAGQMVMQRIGWLSATLLLGCGIILLLARYITPKIASYNRFVLSGNEQDASKGYIAGDNPALLPPPGSQGEVLATLRPAGKIIIDNKIYDAVSNGGFIEKGDTIWVLRLDGSTIIVESTKEIY
ncbi:MAG: serine protease [Parachlamydiaceae bacterium]|nr:serine protease [Parachlamydiaceae bacterium]